MSASQIFRLSLLAGCLSITASDTVVLAQQPQTQTKETYVPQVGQEGKDVVWVPTPQALVDKMLDMAKVTSSDYVIDLGSGDGRTVITAAKRGARALGIEYNPQMVELSKRNAAGEKVGDKATFVKADIFESDFSKATVITMFLLPELNIRLRPTILKLKPGTRIVSNTFTMGEWPDDETATVSEGCTSYCTAHLWIVPAQVQGTWQLPDGRLTIAQEFQMISGTLESGGTSTPIKGRLRADQITFSAGAAEYSGRVAGNAMQGTMKSGARTGEWKGARAAM